MYRIVKRIVRTITTVTLFVRWDDSAGHETVEKQITLPASYSFTEEEMAQTINTPKKAQQPSNQDLEEGEKP